MNAPEQGKAKPFRWEGTMAEFDAEVRRRWIESSERLGLDHGMPNAAAALAAAQEPEQGQECDLSNAQLVGRNGYGEISVAMPRARMTRDEALVHAAWLVVLADGELEIGGVISAICGAQ